METLIIVGIILVILGIIGAVLPGMPGPVLSFAAIVLLFISQGTKIVSVTSLIVFGVVMVLLILADYFSPILGAKFSGSSKRGVRGSIIGTILGIFIFPPFGIFIGSFIGAVLGELSGGKDFQKSLKAGIGTITGSFLTLFLQLIFSIVVAIYFFMKVF